MLAMFHFNHLSGEFSFYSPVSEFCEWPDFLSPVKTGGVCSCLIAREIPPVRTGFDGGSMFWAFLALIIFWDFQ